MIAATSGLGAGDERERARAETSMDFGVMLPYVVETNRANFLEVCRRIDEGPFTYASTGERVDFRAPDNFVLLAAAAAVTSRVRLMPHILQLPLHPLPLVAKRIATLDMVADGRLTLGIGLGGRRSDYEMTDAEEKFDRRLELLSTYMEELRRLWNGESTDAALVAAVPSTTQAGGPPVLWGGTRFGPKTMARAMEWKPDGFSSFTMEADPADLTENYTRRRSAWERAGGKDKPYVNTSLFFALGPNPEEEMRRGAGFYMSDGNDSTAHTENRALSITTAAKLRTAIDNVEAAGYDGLMFLPTTDDPDEIDRLIEVMESR
jgi:alkanesulfonate monooxygenase SsuD/methylene tetrahydromethanopterin reductase-like flavin-dependent oxidoreductase (luciferase family)